MSTPSKDPKPPRVVPVAPRECPPDLVKEVARVLLEGGLVVLPTETVYGVAALLDGKKGESRLRALKGREGEEKPFTIHIGDPEEASRYARPWRACARRLAERYWPGPLTLVVEGLRSESVGLRVPSRLFTRAVLREAGRRGGTVAMASANLPGSPPPTTAREALEALGTRVDLVVDGGKAELAEPSTVVRALPPLLEVLREGTLTREELERTACFGVVFVCSGNTCRSPMAERTARWLAARLRGLPLEQSSRTGVRFFSAGVNALPGLPASEGATAALREWGLDLSDHRSRPLSPYLLAEADLALCMTRGHLSRVRALAQRLDPPPEADLLDPGGEEVLDPFAGDLSLYRKVRDRIRAALEARMEALLERPWAETPK